jgi:16S rRNA (guanine527-N7)-methyltransferase
MSEQTPEQRLGAGIAALAIDVTSANQQKLLQYLALMQKWNKAYNLTAIRDPHDMVIKHLLDSLSIVPWIKGANLLDIGTGGGLPGIPLAIQFPELEVTLLDSNGKKTRFLQQVKTELGLANVNVVHSRVEQYVPPKPFAQIVSRAFSALEMFVDLALPKLAGGGQMLAMKGQMPAEEMASLQQKVEGMQLDVIPLAVPMLTEARHLVLIAPQSKNQPKN